MAYANISLNATNPTFYTENTCINYCLEQGFTRIDFNQFSFVFFSIIFISMIIYRLANRLPYTKDIQDICMVVVFCSSTGMVLLGLLYGFI